MHALFADYALLCVHLHMYSMGKVCLLYILAVARIYMLRVVCIACLALLKSLEAETAKNTTLVHSREDSV